MKRLVPLLFLVAITLNGFAQPALLARSTPEAEGVSSKGILSFLDAAAKSPHEFHSLMILRHGKVIAEGWWDPYKPELKHTLYSVSKTFTATAVGFAVSEGKISVEDQVISFFPDDTPSRVSEMLANLKIKHLLSMTVGQPTDPSGNVNMSSNWARTFLNTRITYEPGTKFLYNSAATYMLSAIVQKVTGQKIIDYLTPRLFTPLGISGMDWEIDPKNINTGGWGLRLKTEDLAKMGQLFLQKGRWKGKQIIPASWIEEASTMKIMQDPDAPQAKKDSSDWLQGYCYQMWRGRHNSFRADGAMGQYIIVLPDVDAVIAITSETANMQTEQNLIWKYLLPAFQSSKLSPTTDTKLLKQRLTKLALPVPSSGKPITPASSVSGKVFYSTTGDSRLKSYGVTFKDDICTLFLHTDSADYNIPFGAGKWVASETTKFGPYLVSRGAWNRRGLPPFKVDGSYAWTDNNTLDLTLRYVESPHTEVFHATVTDKGLDLDIENLFNRNSSRVVFKGIPKNEKPNAPRLIVRGDDMGFSHSADQALIKSYLEGIETSIEVIVPSPWFPETVKLLSQNPRVDVGLHFAITSEWDNVKWRPLTEAKSLRDPDGYFYPMLGANKNYPKMSVSENSPAIADIEHELRAQIRTALKYIPRLSHISGHMGSTTFSPEVKAMVHRVASEYKIPDWDADPNKPANIFYVGFDFNGKSTDERIQAFIEMLDHLEEGKTYIFVEHPGIDNDELKAIYHIGYDDVAKGRQDVTTLFTSEKVRAAILAKGVELVSYKDVLK